MENDNLNIFDPSDPSQKDDMLRALQSAYASVSPEAERGYVKRSAKTGVPVPLLRAKDNRALDTPTDLSELSPSTKQLLLENPSLAIIARGEEKQLDAVRGVAAAAEKPLEVRKSELEEQIRARGYTAAQKQQLKEAGFQQLPSGKWLAPQVKGQNLNKWNSGILLAQALDKRRVELEEVDMPLLPEWYASYNERLSEPLKEFMRNGSSGVIPEELKLQGLTEQDITKALVTDQTLMRALNAVYGTAWRNYDDENLTAAINRVGTALKLPVENYDLARVRERGFSEGLDPMIFKDFLGLASVWKALTSDGTEIESLTRTLNNLDKASPEELKALNDYLLEQNRNMRGSTTGVSLTEGVLESGRFAGELFATGGESAVTRWALSPLLNAGFLRTAGMLLKDIAKGELKRLPYYLPGIVGKEINEAQTLQAFIDDDGGMKAALSEKSADEFSLGIANRVIDTYLTNFSERTGIVLDIAGTSALRKAASVIPAPLLRSAIGRSVRARFGEMTAAKWHTLYKSFLKDANISGVYGEYAEEKIDTFLKWASTSIAQTLDTRLGDFGVNEVFGSPAEEAALFGRVALTTGVFKAPGVALSVRSLADTSRFIDAEKGLKTAFSNMESLSQSPEMVAKVYRSMNLPATGHTEPAKLRVLAQSEEGSDILEKLGVTEEELARAENEGSLVEIPLDKAMGNLDEAQHARLMDITTPADVYSNATAEHLREIEDKGLEAAVKEREEFTKAYDEALAQLSSLGRSTSEVRAAAKILGSFADYFARESGMTAAEWIRNVAFKKMKEADWVKEHEQGAPTQKKPRRGITSLNKDVNLEGFNDSWKATVVLFENAADASTLVHEIEHYAVHMMKCLINSGFATERMASDLRTLEEWALREVGDAEEGFKRYHKNKGPLSKEEWLNVEMNEKIAKAFERFVMEGVAPSAELVGAFSTLKRLMTAVYKSVAALGVPVSDEVRAVFQGMLASEKAVEQSSELTELLKEIDTGILGANQDEIKAFRDLIGLRNDQAWAELDAEKNRQLKELRPVWRKEAEELVKDDPVFSAWKNAVKAGGMDFEDLLEITGEKEALALRDKGLTTAPGRKVKDGSYPNAKRGVHPAEIAKDFDSVEDMVLALLKSDSPYRFVESYVNESETSFVENFAISDAALSVDAATELFEKLSATLEKLSDAKGRTLRLAELRVKVDQEIKGLTVDQILNDRKAAKESASHTGKLVEAIARKDYATAFTEVTQLRHKLELLKHKAFAQKVIRRMDRTLKKGVKAKQGKIEGPYQEALFEIATKFGFSRKSGDFQGKVTAAILEFNKRNPDASMEFSWFDAMEGKPFKGLIFSEVERLAPLTEFLYEEGRYLVSDAKKQESAARKELSEKAVEELSRLTGKLHEIAEDDKVLNAALFAANYGSKLRNIIGWSTNWEENSVIKRGIYDPLMEAQSQSLTLSGEAKRKVKGALDRLAKRSSKWDLDSIADITFPEELRRRFKRYRHWDAEMVVMLCLNMGTAKNIQRMDSGYEWGDMGAEYRNRISALLSAEDWKDIQEVWNAIDDPKITSRLKTTFRNIYHYDLPMEEPASFTVRTSDGAEVALAGGYLPKWYAYRPGNLNASGSTDPMKEKAALPEYRRASFTKESLDEYNAPLDITNSNKIISHILDVAYYVTHAEVLRKVLPVVRDGAFASEFKYRRGAATYNALMKILDNIAKPGEWMEGQTAWWENFSRSLTTALSLWGSLRTAASQFSGATVGLEELRGHYLDALVWFYTDIEKAKSFIYARSGFMRDRGEHFELDMKLMADSSFKGTVKRYNSGLRKIGSFLTTQADMLVACPLWIAAYNKALDATEDDVRAAAEADEFVAKTQGGSRPIDLSTNQLDAFGRVATMFFSSSSAQATHSSALIGKMIRDKRIDLYAITNTLAAPRVLIALVSVLFAGSDDDDDDFFKAFGKELLTNAFSGVPVAEGVIRFLVEGDARGLSDVTLLRAPARIVSSGRDAFSSLMDGEYGRAVYRVAEAASILNGTPVTVAYDRIIRYAEDWADKDLPFDLKEDVGLKKANNRKDNK